MGISISLAGWEFGIITGLLIVSGAAGFIPVVHLL
jgi:hypothetical protein